MKTLKNLFYFVAGICLMVACSKEDLLQPSLNTVNPKSSNGSDLNASEPSLEWQGSFSGSVFKIETVITYNINEFVRIKHIPTWIMVENDDSNPVFEDDFVTNQQRLLIYPVCKNEGEKRCDAIEIEDKSGNKLLICVVQGGCNDQPSVTVNTFTEDPPISRDQINNSCIRVELIRSGKRKEYYLLLVQVY